eukprot:567078-Pelagomonas_calceolata.AAC.1
MEGRMGDVSNNKGEFNFLPDALNMTLGWVACYRVTRVWPTAQESGWSAAGETSSPSIKN